MTRTLVALINNIHQFLRIPTPEKWLNAVNTNLSLLLIDHAHCERKAAATALQFISKYPEKTKIVSFMAPIAREELLHFEKVISLLKREKIDFIGLTPCRYATSLHSLASKDPKDRFIDQLLIAAIIEARSCERFYKILPVLDNKILHNFYLNLVKAEARHFESYLNLAKSYANDIDERLERFLECENKNISSSEEMFRFHSGFLD